MKPHEPYPSCCYPRCIHWNLSESEPKTGTRSVTSMAYQFDQCTWFGRGPGESYRDQNQTLLDNYESPPEKLHSKAIGKPLEAGMSASIHLTARYCTMDDLDRAKHLFDIQRVEATMLCLVSEQKMSHSSLYGTQKSPLLEVDRER